MSYKWVFWAVLLSVVSFSKGYFCGYYEGATVAFAAYRDAVDRVALENGYKREGGEWVPVQEGEL